MHEIVLHGRPPGAEAPPPLGLPIKALIWSKHGPTSTDTIHKRATGDIPPTQLKNCSHVTSSHQCTYSGVGVMGECSVSNTVADFIHKRGGLTVTSVSLDVWYHFGLQMLKMPMLHCRQSSSTRGRTGCRGGGD